MNVGLLVKRAAGLDPDLLTEIEQGVHQSSYHAGRKLVKAMIQFDGSSPVMDANERP